MHWVSYREPLTYTVTVKHGYNPSRLKTSGIDVYTVKAYVRRKNRDIPKLMEYGRRFQVEHKLKTYLEVLL